MERKKKWALCVCMSLVAVCVLVQPVSATEIMLGDQAVNVLGYVTQGTSYGLHDDSYYTEEGFNQALMNIFVEADCRPSYDWMIYISGMLTVDWMYNIKENDDSWENKMFDKSDDYLEVDDEYWQLLKEFHISWAPTSAEAGAFFVRAGKQIVSWGEMDMVRIMDRINPLDGSRGIADVEFENTIIPIWLLRMDYYFPDKWLGPFETVGLQFVFNPNADWIPDKGLKLGNDEVGVWAPELQIHNPLGFPAPAPFDIMYIGADRDAGMNADEPDNWDSDYYEYGIRLTLQKWGHMFNFSYFYGIENGSSGLQIGEDVDFAYDGRLVYHRVMAFDHYPRMKFWGFSATGDLRFIRIPALGSVNPVYRLEMLYEQDTTFQAYSPVNAWFDKHDVFRAGLGFDWKVKFSWLPQKSYIQISPQVFYAKVKDHPGSDYLITYQDTTAEEESFSYTLFLMSSYFNARFMPSVFWWHDDDFDGDFLQVKLDYVYSNYWKFTLGGNFMDGKEDNADGLDAFEDKDMLFMKVTYQFG